MLIKLPRRWTLPESAVTPRGLYEARRTLVGSLQEEGLVGRRLTRREAMQLGASGLVLAGCGQTIKGLDTASILGTEDKNPKSPKHTVDARACKNSLLCRAPPRGVEPLSSD